MFGNWNKGELDSFLIEISSKIMRFKDSDGEALVEKIRDTAGQKGTGKWTAIAGIEHGTPVTLIGQSVFARCLSSLKVSQPCCILEGEASVLYSSFYYFVLMIISACFM